MYQAMNKLFKILFSKSFNLNPSYSLKKPTKKLTKQSTLYQYKLIKSIISYLFLIRNFKKALGKWI